MLSKTYPLHDIMHTEGVKLLWSRFRIASFVAKEKRPDHTCRRFRLTLMIEEDLSLPLVTILINSFTQVVLYNHYL